MDNQPTSSTTNPQNQPSSPTPPDAVQFVPRADAYAGQPDYAAAPPVQPLTKYRVFQAVRDTLLAIKHNALTYLVSVLVAGAVTLVSSVVVVAGGVALLAAISWTASSGVGALVGLIIGATVLATIWFALAGAFLLSYTALALQAGADGHKSGIWETLRTSFGRMGRVVVANVLVSVVAFWPVAATAAVVLALGSFNSGQAMFFAFLLPMAAIIWIFIAWLRLMLAPYVALFEPEVPVTKVLSRSKRLMLGGGQWFVVKGVGLLLLILIVLGVATNSTLQDLQHSSNPVVNLILIIVSMISGGVVVMLYRNRKAVKG